MKKFNLVAMIVWILAVAAGCTQSQQLSNQAMPATDAAVYSALQQGEDTFRDALNDNGGQVNEVIALKGKLLAEKYMKHNRVMEAAWTYQAIGDTHNEEVLIRKIENTLKNGRVKRSGNLGGGINPTVWMEFDTGFYGVFKADTQNEEGSWNTHYRHEVAAYLVDYQLRIGIVPVTVEGSFGGKVGSIQYYVKDAESGADTGYNKGRRITYLDYLIQNYDRHTNNYLYRLKVEPVAVDHGAAFGILGYNGNESLEKWELGPRLVKALLFAKQAHFEPKLLPLLRASFNRLKRSCEAVKRHECVSPLLSHNDQDYAFKKFIQRLKAAQEQYR